MVKTYTWLRANFPELPEKQINPNSIDLTLGNNIIVWKRVNQFNFLKIAALKHKGYSGYSISETYTDFGTWYVFKKEFHLPTGYKFTFKPDSFYLVHSLETITTPKGHVAIPYLKSSSARESLNHPATMGDVGFSGQWNFEISSVARPVTRTIGIDAIAQLMFIECDEHPDKDYAVKGRYQHQIKATESKGVT